MNVVAVSTQSGSLLWTKKKFTNNPNAIFLDGKAILGVGKQGSHVVIDPVSGEELEDLNFRKTACTRLTASGDSLFVRGEGTLRMDRATKKVLVDGSARPACNDGALPANGMLYLGPWGCDCNLSLIGAVGKCSAGDFRFDVEATDADRLRRGEGDILAVAEFEIADGDWPMYRANIERSGSTPAVLARPNQAQDAPGVPQWTFTPPKPCIQAPPVSAGGLVFLAASDGKVRALDAKTGGVRWEFATAGPIKASVTIADGRAYVGSGDGNVYCLEAASGRLLWKFNAAPAERKIFVYDYLTSTWPVNSGVLVHEGVAYFAAGIIDYDGTYVIAVDAKTGKIKWQNNSSGHLSDELRKGVSVQGNLTILGGELLLAGGNQVTPARFNLETGECANRPYANPGANGRPIANHGKFVGVLGGKYSIAGGRTLYSSPKNVANKDSFILNTGRGVFTLNMGGIPPAWNDDALVMVNFTDGKLTCCDAAQLAARIEKGYPEQLTPAQRRFYALSQALEADGGVRWTSDLDEPNKFEALSIAVCPKSVVAAVQFQDRTRAQPQWSTVAFDTASGTAMWFWRHNLPGEPLPGGLIVGRQGQVILAMLDGSLLSLAPIKPRAPQGVTDRAR
jgi:outer membrane protein assembly factor BamB